MKESRIKRQVLAYGIPTFETGQDFQAPPWPLHLTLVAPFQDARQGLLRTELKDFVGQTCSLQMVIGEHAIFGPDREGKDVPVELVEPAGDLRKLHSGLMACVIRAGGIWDDTSHSGYKYSPHISNRENIPLEPVYELDSIAIIDNLGDDSYRVREVFDLQ